MHAMFLLRTVCSQERYKYSNSYCLLAQIRYLDYLEGMQAMSETRWDQLERGLKKEMTDASKIILK